MIDIMDEDIGLTQRLIARAYGEARYWIDKARWWRNFARQSELVEARERATLSFIECIRLATAERSLARDLRKLNSGRGGHLAKTRALVWAIKIS